MKRVELSDEFSAYIDAIDAFQEAAFELAELEQPAGYWIPAETSVMADKLSAYATLIGYKAMELSSQIAGDVGSGSIKKDSDDEYTDDSSQEEFRGYIERVEAKNAR